MLNLTRPRYVMPFHGDFKRIHLHAKLAEAVGIGLMLGGGATAR